MKPDLNRDLAAWEQGVLPRDELESRHGAEAHAVLVGHDALIRAATGPSVDVDDAWAAFSSRLDEPGPVVHLARRRLRTAAFAVAAALMLAGSAIAVVGPDVGDGPEVIAPSPVSSGGGVSDSRANDREGIGATTPEHGIDDAAVDGSQKPDEDPSAGDGDEDSQSEDSQGDDSQGDDSQGDDSQGDDSQGDDSQSDDSQSDDSQSDDSQDADDLSEGDQGGDAEGSDASDGGNSGDGQNDQD